MKPYLDLKKWNQPFLEAFQQDLQQCVLDNAYIMGEGVAEFEAAYAQFIGTEHCIGVANGTDALFIILKNLGIGPGHQVLVQAHTCDATWAAVYATGATPVPADVRLDTLNLDTALLPEHTTAKALVVVHMNGAPADMDPITAYCQTHNLYLIEDNAQATGATYNGRLTGSFGVAAAHSFYPTKPLGALGDGGAITTADPDLAAKMRVFANYGRALGQWATPSVVGINSRLDELQARFLLRKLPFVYEHIADRALQAHAYKKALAGFNVTFQQVLPGCASAHHLCTVLHANRAELQAHLANLGIETRIHYPYAPFVIAAYGYAESAAPVAARIARETLSLPL